MPEQENTDARPPEEITPSEQAPAAEADAASEEGKTSEEAVTEPALWGKLVPELAGQYAELKPEAREQVLLQRLARTESAQAAPTADRPRKESATEEEDEGELPPIEPAPTLDIESLGKEVARGMEEGNPQVVVAALKQVVQHADAVMQRADKVARYTYGAIKEQSQDIQDLRVPGLLRDVMATVPGAKPEDVAEARRIYDDGEATTAQAAVSLAVFRRTNASQPKAKPSEEARRKAQSLSAARAGVEDEGRRGVSVRIPETPAETREFMAAEERNKQSGARQ